MATLYTIAIICIVLQILFTYQIYRNCEYYLDKSSQKRTAYSPKVALIVPCKGIDTEFEKNISSFYAIEYESYELLFVVESVEDAAYKSLLAFKDKYSAGTKAFDVKVLVAGVAEQGSQKLHNLLCGYNNISAGIEVLAFADSDACVKSKWIRHITYQLRKERFGAATGYRWFVPLKNNFATLALCSLNARVAQLLGNTRFNKAWGGSMAIRVEIFKKLELDKIWKTAASDDLTVTRACGQNGLLVAFVPACFAASYEETTWKKMFEFARRQFIITRVTTPGTWLFGLFSGLFPVLGEWGFAAAAIYGYSIGYHRWIVFAAASATFFILQMTRAIMRQWTMIKMFPENASKMKVAAVADIIGGPLWSILLLGCIISSAFTRTIQWRGVNYKLKSPTKVKRL